MPPQAHATHRHKKARGRVNSKHLSAYANKATTRVRTDVIIARLLVNTSITESKGISLYFVNTIFVRKTNIIFELD